MALAGGRSDHHGPRDRHSQEARIRAASDQQTHTHPGYTLRSGQASTMSLWGELRSLQSTQSHVSQAGYRLRTEREMIVPTRVGVSGRRKPVLGVTEAKLDKLCVNGRSISSL